MERELSGNSGEMAMSEECVAGDPSAREVRKREGRDLIAFRETPFGDAALDELPG